MNSKATAIALLLVFNSVGCSAWNWYYERDLREVRRRLESIPGVVVKSIGGNEDLTLEDIFATVEIAGPRELSLGYVTSKSFELGGGFFVRHIGTMSPRYTSYGHQGVYESATGRAVRSHAYGSGLPFGSAGEFVELVPVRVARIQDVIQHAELLETTLKQWPRCPAYFEPPKTPDAKRYRLCVTEPGTHIYPPDFQ